MAEFKNQDHLKALNQQFGSYLKENGEVLLPLDNAMVKFVGNRGDIVEEEHKMEMPLQTTAENFVRNFTDASLNPLDPCYPFHYKRWSHWIEIQKTERMLEKYHLISCWRNEDYHLRNDNFFKSWVCIATHPSIGKMSTEDANYEWLWSKWSEAPGYTSMNVSYHKERRELLHYRLLTLWSNHRKWAYLDEENKMVKGYCKRINAIILSREAKKLLPEEERKKLPFDRELFVPFFKIAQQFTADPQYPLVMGGYAILAQKLQGMKLKRESDMELERLHWKKIKLHIFSIRNHSADEFWDMYYLGVDLGRSLVESFKDWRDVDIYNHTFLQNQSKCPMHRDFAVYLGATEKEAVEWHHTLHKPLPKEPRVFPKQTVKPNPEMGTLLSLRWLVEMLYHHRVLGDKQFESAPFFY